MAKLQYGNYSAWLTGDILRVACDNKLVRMETVPPDALRYFREAFDMDKRDAAREKAKALKTAQEASKPSKGKVGRPKKQNAAESLSAAKSLKFCQHQHHYLMRRFLHLLLHHKTQTSTAKRILMQ